MLLTDLKQGRHREGITPCSSDTTLRLQRAAASVGQAADLLSIRKFQIKMEKQWKMKD